MKSIRLHESNLEFSNFIMNDVQSSHIIAFSGMSIDVNSRSTVYF